MFFFFHVLCSSSLPDQRVCPPIAHHSRNGKFRGIESPSGLREFRSESLALHPSKERNCGLSTEVSLHATVLSGQRPKQKCHRVSVTVNTLFIYMVYRLCNPYKFYLICICPDQIYIPVEHVRNIFKSSACIII